MRGHVRKRGNSWSVVYDEGHDEDGKRRQRWLSGFKTKKEASAALTKALHGLGSGDYVTPSETTFAAYLTAWLETITPKSATLTVATYRRVVRKHLVPALGRKPLQRLTATDFDGLYARLGKTLQPATVRMVHNVAHKALDDAVRKQLLTRNPARYADPPKVPRVTRRTWSARELRQFVGSTADVRLHSAFLFSATTGVSRGELLGLRWFDLDLENGRASIVQTVIPTGGKRWEIKPSTKDGGSRQIALDATTVAALEAHKERQLGEREAWGEAYDDHDLVFTRENGEPLDPNRFSELFASRLKAAKLPHIRLHDLRHTHATLALAAGVHPKVVQERLGHASVKMTLDRYSHAIPALEETAAELVAGLVFRPALADR
jgi:integrase